MRRRNLIRALITGAGGAIAWACGVRSDPVPAATQTITAAAPTIVPTPSLTRAATPMPAATPAALRDAQGRLVFIETHAHLLVGGTGSGLDFDGAVAKIGPELDQHSAKLAVLMNPPSSAGKLEISERERGVYDKARSARYLVPLGGGGSLNPVIHQNAKSANVSADLMKGFAALAEQHITSGAVGFGEMAVLHLSFSPQHSFEEVAADHPMWLLLAEVAAKHDVPIDVHMDAMAEDGPTPQRNRLASPLNPPTLKANVPGFERLLAHDRRAKIVWAHAGSDRTGQVSVALYDRLMAAHPNLYLQLVLNTMAPPQVAQNPNNLVDPRGQIRPAYIGLMRKYADRIVLGGDSFFAAPGASGPLAATGADRPYVSDLRALVDKLPPDVAGKIAIDNALRIYKIKL